ncbi:MAG: hypothetical protein ACR2MO_10145 [Acidimicrobiales bacterium]
MFGELVLGDGCVEHSERLAKLGKEARHLGGDVSGPDADALREAVRHVRADADLIVGDLRMGRVPTECPT